MPSIPKRTRHDISRALEIESLFLDWGGFLGVLQELWVIDNESAIDRWFASAGDDQSLRARIERHVARNPGDWSTHELFDQLGAFEASDRRFALFLEGLSSCAVLPNEGAQRAFVELVNRHLDAVGAKLEEIGNDGGYPIFRITSIGNVRKCSPKNLIFGSSGVKPDIRFRSAVDNDIEIVSNADRVLVYDRPIGEEGLKWEDLQKWWEEKEGLTDSEEAKQKLYRRLRAAIPADSPPQLELFDAYHHAFGTAIPRLPALIPEIWLHWDPKTVKQRGREALLRFRMDFLLLLPHRHRIVLEVDGRHHYSNTDGQAAPSVYAENMAADRDLKLAGYEVFRFGATELSSQESARRTAGEFFKNLFLKYEVRVSRSR